MNNKKIHNYHEFIADRLSSTDDVNDLIDNIKNHCSNNIYNKIDLIECNTNKDRIYNIVEEILIKDMIKKYNDGVWDGIVYKIAKKTWKNNKIML
jgi:hypothetical protein